MTSRTLLRLNKAQVYVSYHGMQDRDAEIALKKYKQMMKWGSKHKILDIGCGPGDLTYNYLLPLTPENGEMLGIDISQSMIHYANSNYKDSRLSFEVMDITNPTVGEKYALTYDSVFSFYCLHWIQDQWNTMKNIYSILKNGGETLLIFLASSPIYTLYEILASSPKWAPYMHDYKEVISPYHYSTDPVSDIRNLMQSIGFHVKDCFCTPTSYTVPSKEILYIPTSKHVEDSKPRETTMIKKGEGWIPVQMKFTKSIQAVNPFLNRIPEHLLEEYTEECNQKIWKANLCSLEKTNEVTFSYSLITIYAHKPH